MLTSKKSRGKFKRLTGQDNRMAQMLFTEVLVKTSRYGGLGHMVVKIWGGT